MKNDKTQQKVMHSAIDELLAEITPLERRRTEEKMLLSARLADLISEKNWSKSAFAKKVGKEPSEITKWLSGTHNFTLDILTEIAFVLDIPLAKLLGQATETGNIVLEFTITPQEQERMVIDPYGPKAKFPTKGSFRQTTTVHNYPTLTYTAKGYGITRKHSSVKSGAL